MGFFEKIFGPGNKAEKPKEEQLQEGHKEEPKAVGLSEEKEWFEKGEGKKSVEEIEKKWFKDGEEKKE